MTTQKARGVSSIDLCTEKYRKPKRFPYSWRPKHKRVLTKEEMNFLLNQRLVVEEKMDGKMTSICAGALRLFLEDLKYKHSIKYRVPARFVLFDILDMSRGVFLNRDDKVDVYNILLRKKHLLPEPLRTSGFFLVDEIARGVFTLEALEDLLDKITSRYVLSEDKRPEGIVVKPARELYFFEYTAGKLVRPEFEDGIETHYLRRERERNIIDPRMIEEFAHPS